MILKAFYTGACPGDSTWFNLRFIMGNKGDKVTADNKVTTKDGEKTQGIYFNVQVPTASVKYGLKGGLFMFTKVQQFAAGFGDLLDTENAFSKIPKLFAEPSSFVGKTIKVRLGYEGAHTEFKDGKHYAMDAKGELLTLSAPNEFESRELAEGQMVMDGFEIKGFLAVLRVLPGQAPETTEDDATDWE